jgi:hypothetical protein
MVSTQDGALFKVGLRAPSIVDQFLADSMPEVCCSHWRMSYRFVISITLKLIVCILSFCRSSLLDSLGVWTLFQ